MKTFARITNGAVAEVVSTTADITTMFHPSLQWLDVTSHPLQVGWLRQADGTFAAPPTPAITVSVPTLADVKAQLATLTAEVAALSSALAPKS